VQIPAVIAGRGLVAAVAQLTPLLVAVVGVTALSVVVTAHKAVQVGAQDAFGLP